MELILKAAAVAAVGAAALALIKSRVPEFAPLGEAAAVLGVVLFAVEAAKSFVPYAEDFLSAGLVDSGYAVQLFKALGVAVAAQFAAEICRDSDNSAIAFALETAAKIVIISMSLPMLLNLSDIVNGLLKG